MERSHLASSPSALTPAKPETSYPVRVQEKVKDENTDIYKG
jgi:hypothetical protein